jgi:FKBP-type peptidyl-prolyl cis-trans isomerase 2
MAKTRKGDFIEVEYTGYANGEIFDTNIREKARELGDIEARPLILCIGQEMVVKGFDRQLADKEVGKEYKIEITPEEGFGKRNPSLIKTVPMSAFREQQMNPAPGMMLNMDGMIAKILSVSGGRVITDFNNPLSGKDIEYEFTVRKIITDDKEKIDSLQDFFFKKKFNFKIEGKKVVFEPDAQPFVKIVGKKLGEILGKEIEVEHSEKTAKKQEKK